uniref:MFS transporter n=1 Tax=Cyberlindnera americana TaxID=36016 RepID=A0A5P8N8Q0_9ASCO|nr:MFS transporter [Cyberlindnera americana]
MSIDLEEKRVRDPEMMDTQSTLETGMADVIRKDNTEAESNDAVLAQKIHLINNAIDEVGFTWHHAKLFVIAGFGYSIDSQMEMIQSSVKVYVDYQMLGTGFPISNEIFYAGLICGSIVFGMGSDLIGRKVVFNTSIFLTSIFGFLTGGMDSYPMYCIFMFLSAFAAGGNIATDVAVFLEYLPSKYQYLNTTMALFWGVGQTIAALISWAFIPNNSCDGADYCPSNINRGWRYCWYVNSGVCLFAALVRVFVLKMEETPKFLVTCGKDEDAFEVLKNISDKYDRPLTLTVEDLKSCGTINQDYFDPIKDGYSIKALLQAMVVNLKILFQSKIVARSTLLVFLSWGFIGISYSTFYNFLYIFIAMHGGDTGSTVYITYRNATIDNFVGIFGPILAGALILVKFKAFGREIMVGRRGTMAFGALASMAILFGYTTVRTPAGDAGFGSATYFFINIYYATLYAYTPEIFPTKARGTGVGVSLVVSRVFGAFAPVVYYFGAKSSSSVPIWVCGAIIGSLSIIALLMPFEPSRKRVV